MSAAKARGGDKVEKKGRKRPLMVEVEEQAPNVNLTVKGQDGGVVYFRIRRNNMLLNLLRAYCEKKQLEYRSIQFFYNGERFPVKSTPDDLDMEDGEEIDAMMHLTGGGCEAI